MQKIPSGIVGFDKISKGGIPKERVTTLFGPLGSGKTTFSAQFLIGGILISKEAGVFVTFEDSPENIILNMKDFDWDILEHIKKGLWEFVDASPHEENLEFSGDYDLGGLLIQIKTAIEKIKAKRVVLDSLNALFSRFPNAEIIKREIDKLKSWLESLSVTSIITNEIIDNNQKNISGEMVKNSYENIIRLKNNLNKELNVRTIEILKYQEEIYIKGKHQYNIKSHLGIEIIPSI